MKHHHKIVAQHLVVSRENVKQVVRMRVETGCLDTDKFTGRPDITAARDER